MCFCLGNYWRACVGVFVDRESVLLETVLNKGSVRGVLACEGGTGGWLEAVERDVMGGHGH